MVGYVHLDEDEAKEVFRILKNIADDAHYAHRPKKDWPLYDHLARTLGENDLATHNEALRLRDEEETFDERFEDRGDDDE